MGLLPVFVSPFFVRSVAAESDLLPLLSRSRRVVILGDSITYGGEYVDYFETWFRIQNPTADTEFINLGLPSETVSGLSEPGHAGGAFPRPDLHERLDRVLEKTKPDLVFACYGMNDGIYYPPSRERLAAFQRGMERLREKVSAAGAKIVHITPPVFDPLPLKGRTLPAGLQEYPQPYEGYNAVLDEYSAWLLEQARSKGWMVIDAHTPMNEFLANQRKSNPAFILAGDGVHANAQGHWLIAREILRALGASPELCNAATDAKLLTMHPRAPEILKLVQSRQRLLKDAWLSEIGHKRPGMNKGEPLPEAKRESAGISKKLSGLLQN